jgi:hypothetical protein
MPYRIKSPVTHRQIGRRGACLLIFGLVPLAVGGSYFLTPKNQAGHYRTIPVLQDLAPASWWSGVWLILGAGAMLCAFGEWHWVRRGLIIGYMLPLIWGAANLISWMRGELVTGWISAVIYLGYSLLVIIVAGWEEPTDPLNTAALRESSDA